MDREFFPDIDDKYSTEVLLHLIQKIAIAASKSSLDTVTVGCCIAHHRLGPAWHRRQPLQQSSLWVTRATGPGGNQKQDLGFKSQDGMLSVALHQVDLEALSARSNACL